MKPLSTSWTDDRVQRLIGHLLRWGVLLAAAVVILGASSYLVRYGAPRPDPCAELFVCVLSPAVEVGARVANGKDWREGRGGNEFRAARAKKCDLIVMASHGRRGLSGLLLGKEANPDFTIEKVSGGTSEAHVKATLDEVNADPAVLVKASTLADDSQEGKEF